MPSLVVMKKQACLQRGPMRMPADLLGLMYMFSVWSSSSQIFNIDWRLVREGGNRSMSSAYTMMLTHLEARWQPLQQQMILLIALSMNIANRQGDRKPPWRTPADYLKNGVVMMHTSSTGSFLPISWTNRAFGPSCQKSLITLKRID